MGKVSKVDILCDLVTKNVGRKVENKEEKKK